MKILTHEIDVDAANDQWACFGKIARWHSDAEDPLNGFAEIESQWEEIKPVIERYPTRNLDPRDGLSLFVGHSEPADKIMFVFDFKEKYGPTGIKIRFVDTPVQIGDTGWDPSSFVSDIKKEKGGLRASFILDLKKCKTTKEYKLAKKAGSPYVRLPLIYRAIDKHLDFPPGMIPNDHSVKDLTRFEAGSHTSPRPHTHGTGHEHGHDHHHAGDEDELNLFRHWGPHFMDSYSIYLQLN